jgi:hypothetical protein
VKSREQLSVERAVSVMEKFLPEVPFGGAGDGNEGVEAEGPRVDMVDTSVGEVVGVATVCVKEAEEKEVKEAEVEVELKVVIWLV